MGERPVPRYWSEDDLPADCNPMVRSIAQYWLGIGPDDALPGRQHFDPIDIWPLIKNVWIVDVDGSPPRFRYRVVGTKVVEYVGEEPVGWTMDEVFPHFEESETGKDFARVVEERKPRWRRGNPTLRRDKDFKTVEQIFLPLARDGRNVDMVLNLTVYMNANGEVC
jgi:hypothetical protein